MHTAMHSRSKRIRNVVIGLAMAGGAGLGLAASLPANAASGDLGTWILNVHVASANTKMRSFEIVWVGSSGGKASACYPISPGESKTFNQTGILGQAANVQGFAAAGCPEDQKLTPHPTAGFNQFATPSDPGLKVSVTFNLGSVSASAGG